MNGWLDAMWCICMQTYVCSNAFDAWYFPHVISKTQFVENRIENWFIYRLLSIRIVPSNSIENRKHHRDH